MAETTWLASQVASLIPNMFSTENAAASSSFSGSGSGSVQCSTWKSCFTEACATNNAMLAGTSFTQCTNGYFFAVPTCCSACC